MLYLGLIVTIISYVILLTVVMIYCYYFFKKNWKKAITFELITFMTSLFTSMISSWMIIVMNGDFNLNFGINFSIVPFIFVAISMPLLIISSLTLKKYKNSASILTGVSNFLMPALTLIGIFVSTLVLSYNVSYFIYIMK